MDAHSDSYPDNLYWYWSITIFIQNINLVIKKKELESENLFGHWLKKKHWTGWWFQSPWKIIISQLGWWHSQLNGKIKKCSSHHQPVTIVLTTIIPVIVVINQLKNIEYLENPCFNAICTKGLPLKSTLDHLDANSKAVLAPFVSNRDGRPFHTPRGVWTVGKRRKASVFIYFYMVLSLKIGSESVELWLCHLNRRSTGSTIFLQALVNIFDHRCQATSGKLICNSQHMFSIGKKSISYGWIMLSRYPF